MYADDQEQRTRQVAAHKLDSKVEAPVHACEGRIRQVERAATEAAHRAEEVKWRIDGRGIQPRRRSHERRSWTVHPPRVFARPWLRNMGGADESCPLLDGEEVKHR